jgi:transcriptional regulator with XRE-family HTH domain
MPDDASIIGRRIRLLRINKALTQAELARACGVSLNQVNGWEMGRYVAALKRRPAVAKALGVQPEMLFYSGEERALLLDEAATEAMLSVARDDKASPAQRLSAARGLQARAAAEPPAQMPRSDFRKLMETTALGLDTIRARFGLDDDD